MQKIFTFFLCIVSLCILFALWRFVQWDFDFPTLASHTSMWLATLATHTCMYLATFATHTIIWLPTLAIHTIMWFAYMMCTFLLLTAIFVSLCTFLILCPFLMLPAIFIFVHLFSVLYIIPPCIALSFEIFFCFGRYLYGAYCWVP